MNKIRDNYYVCILVGKNVTYELITGEKIVIEGFEELDLFLHQPFIPNPVRKIWMVSEGKTGASITGWAINPEEAKKFAKEKLESEGIERVRTVINRQLELTHSPRF